MSSGLPNRLCLFLCLLDCSAFWDVGEGSWEVLCAGHLLIDPPMVLDLDRPGLDEDLPTATATRRRILAQAADEGFALNGPLWPSPGVARVSQDGDGFTLVPLNLHWKAGKVKCEVALAKGKAEHDKRDTIRDREGKREVERALKHRSR